MGKTIYFALGGIVIAAILVIILTLPDHRTTGQRLGDAVDELPHGVDKAAGELKDKTPAGKAGDALKKVGDKASKSAKDLTP